jgi:hypothetical protein
MDTADANDFSLAGASVAEVCGRRSLDFGCSVPALGDRRYRNAGRGCTASTV